MEVEEGEIRALIGPNGSGKTTFVNVITGIYTPDEGSMRFCGTDVRDWRAHSLARLGISRTFQTIRVFSRLTVLQNVMVGHYQWQKSANMLDLVLNTKCARDEELACEARARRALDTVGLDSRLERLSANALSHGQQRLLEIARALCNEPRLLILDEPAAGLNPGEVDRLMETLRRIRAGGVTILIIEHNMHVVMPLADRVSVLNFGKKIAEGSPQEVRENEEVITAYLGKRGVEIA